MSANKAAMMKRREKDIFKLRSSQRKVQASEHDSTYLVEFCGPQDTPYELGRWTINLYLPEDYPYKSPSVGFLNKIYHPNIDYSSGSVCLDVINQTWTPMYELLNIFEIFLPQLLTYPNPASPLNQEAALLYEQNLEKYNQTVQECISKHALNKELVHERKKSQELQQKQKEAEEALKQNKKPQREQQVRVGEQSMDQEGSQLSEHDSILDNDDLKLY